MKGKLVVYFLLMSILTLGLVQAGTLTVPLNGAEICGTATFTYPVVTSDVTNVTLWRTETNGSINLWHNIASVGNISANQSTFTISYDTTGLTDSLTYKFNMTASGSANESGYINNSNVDNTAPVVSWASANTADSSINSVKSEDFVVSITSDENLVSPTITIGSKIFTLSGSESTWSYSFSDNEIAEGSYRYSVSSLVDNTTCGNTATPITRWVVIDDGSNLAGTQVIIASGATEPVQRNPLVILLLLGIGYYLIKGKKRKR